MYLNSNLQLSHKLIVFLHRILQSAFLNMFMISLLLLGISCSGAHGPVKDIADLKVVGNKICFMDEKIVGKRNPVNACRLFIVDAENGTQLKKEQLGYNVKLLMSSGNLLLIGNDKGYILYNTDKLAIEQDLSKEALEKNVSPFNEGIDEMKFLYNVIEVSTKTGLVYCYDPFTGSATRKEDVKPLDLNHNSYDDLKIYNFHNGFIKDIFLMKRENSASNRQIVQSVANDSNGNKIISEDYFIEGRFAGLLDEDKLMLVSSYTNTDRVSQILTCLGYDLKTKWRATKTDFGMDESEENFLNFEKYKDKLILTAGKYLLCIQISNGKLVWKQTY